MSTLLCKKMAKGKAEGPELLIKALQDCKYRYPLTRGLESEAAIGVFGPNINKNFGNSIGAGILGHTSKS